MFKKPLRQGRLECVDGYFVHKTGHVSDLLTLSTDMINFSLTKNQLSRATPFHQNGAMNHANPQHTPRLYGEALRNLRKARGLSLETLAALVGVSKQSIHAWEMGRAYPRDEHLSNLFKALSANEAVLKEEIGRIGTEAGVEIRFAAPPWHARFNEELVSFEIKDEDMSPYVEQGETVLYEVDRAPRRLEGCVLTLASGQTLVRRYEKRADGYIYVTQLNPEKTEQYLWSEVKGLHRIALRGS